MDCCCLRTSFFPVRSRSNTKSLCRIESRQNREHCQDSIVCWVRHTCSDLVSEALSQFAVASCRRKQDEPLRVASEDIHQPTKATYRKRWPAEAADRSPQTNARRICENCRKE